MNNRRAKINIKDLCHHLNPFDNYNYLLLERLDYRNGDYPCLEFVSNCKNPCVKSDGYIDCEIMIIGQNPGKEEDENDLPFIGPSGRLLMQVLEDLGFKREDFYITNSIKCFLDTEKIREVHLKFCASSILRREISIVKPKKVLILGDIALKGFFYAINRPFSKGKYERGEVYKISAPDLNLVDIEFLYTYHPSYILRNLDNNNNYFKKQFVDHISKLLQNYKISINFKLEDNIVIIDNDEKCENILFPKLEKMIKEDIPIVLDLETISVESNSKDNEILIMGIGYEDITSHPIIWYEYDKFSRKLISRLSEENKRKIIFEYLPKLKLINHNLKFDLMVLYRIYGIDLQENIYSDTIVLHHLICEEGPHDLKSLANMYTPFKNYADEISQTLKKFKDKWYQVIDYKQLATYCGYDCLATYYLYKLFLEKLKQEWDKIEKFNEQQFKNLIREKVLKRSRIQFNVANPDNTIMRLYQIVMKHYKLLFEMEKNGLPFDLEYIDIIKKEVLEKINQLDKEMREIAGLKENSINWNSSVQIRELFKSKGYISPIKTPKGELSYSEEALQYLADQGIELAKLLLEYRRLQKALTTYLSIPEEYAPYLRDTSDDFIKRLSCKIKVHGTETGRLSTSDPSFHTIPRDNTYRRMIRAERGWLIVSADYSMADLRMIAAYSCCKSMLADFNSGLDFHTLQASKIFKKKPEEITKEERSIAKNINFAIAYLGSEQVIAQMLNIDKQLAQKYREEWFKDKIEVQIWINAIQRYYDFFKEGEIVEFWNIFGRKRRIRRVKRPEKGKLIGEYGHKIREAVNFFPQSTVADMLMIGLLRFDKMIKERGYKDFVRLLLTIHDALLLEVKEEVIDKVIPIIKEAMEFPLPFIMEQIIVPVDITVSERWEKD